MGHVLIRVLGDNTQKIYTDGQKFVVLTTFQWLVSSSVKVGMIIILISGLQGA